jgi:hypothetical protein
MLNVLDEFSHECLAIYLVPGIKPSSTPQWRPHRKAACGKTARAV